MILLLALYWRFLLCVYMSMSMCMCTVVWRRATKTRRSESSDVGRTAGTGPHTAARVYQRPRTMEMRAVAPAHCGARYATSPSKHHCRFEGESSVVRCATTSCGMHSVCVST